MTDRASPAIPAIIILTVVVGLWSAGHASAQPGVATSISPKIADQLTGLTWSGHGLIVSYGEKTGGLLNLSLDGRTVAPFAPSFSTYNESYIALSNGLAGFPQGHLFVSSNRTIYELDPSGSSYKVFSTPPGASRIGYLAFDTLGAWGYQLLALDDNGLLWTIASNGTAHVVTDFGAKMKPESIAVAPQSFGRFAGYLFIGLEYAFKVVAVPPNDPQHPIEVVETPNEGPERILLVPPSSDLYVAMFNGSVLKVSAATLAPYVGTLLLITEGDSQPVGSMTSLSVVGDNVNGTRFLQLEGRPHFEGADFVAASLGETWTTSARSQGSGTGTSGQAGLPSTWLFGVAAVTVVVVVVAWIIIRRR